MEKEFLNIQTHIEREKIKIDGEDFFIVSPEEFSYADFISMQNTARRFFGNEIKDEEYTPKRIKQLDKAISQIVDKVLIAPRKIKKKLTLSNKTELLTFFLNRRRETRQSAQSTKSSLGSNVSTEEHSGNG